MAARGISGAGDIYIARFTPAGVPGPYVFADDGSKFEFKFNSSVQEMKSRGRSDYGQIKAAKVTPEPADFSITLTTPTAENLALALMGGVSATSQAAATITDEPVIAALGKHVPLAHSELNPVGVEVTNTGGTTTYVDGTDYVVNHRLGTIKALPGGAITAAQALLVSYATLVSSETVIDGGVIKSLRAAVLFDGVNTVDDSKLIANVWEAVLTPNGSVDLLAEGWVDVALSGRMVTPAGKPGPMRLRMPAGA